MAFTNYRLQSIEYAEGNDSIILELSDVDEFLLGNVAELNKKMDINNVYGQGATNIWQVGPVIDNFEKTASTTYKITLKIYIPTEAIAINKIKLNWNLRGYRTYTNIASQTTGVPSVTHTHSINLNNFDNSSDTYVMGMIGNVNLIKASGFVPTTFGTNSNSADHTHTISVSNGIAEEADTNPTMQLDVNGVGIGTYAGDQTDIDITDNIVYGWNQVDLYPTTNVRGRCQLDAFVQVFLESK